MSRPKPKLWQLPDDHICRSIYREFVTYANDSGYYLSPNALWVMMTKPIWDKKTRKKIPPRYEIPRGQFDYWFGRLIEEGYIAKDGNDYSRAVKSTAHVIAEIDGEIERLE